MTVPTQREPTGDRHGPAGKHAPGLPYAVAAALAYPDRMSVAIVGDGGFAMLMAELTTAVRLNLPVKVMILKNNSLAEVRFEQTPSGIDRPVSNWVRSTSLLSRRPVAPPASMREQHRSCGLPSTPR